MTKSGERPSVLSVSIGHTPTEGKDELFSTVIVEQLRVE
jgi:hypothetical protein